MRMDDIVMCARLAGLLAFVLAAGLALTAHAGEGPPRDGTAAIRTADFLNSIGINTTFPNRGQPIEKTIDPARPSAPASEAGAETRNQAEGELSILSPELRADSPTPSRTSRPPCTICCFRRATARFS